MMYTGFFEEVLKQIGAPVTNNNLAILSTWAKYEGGKAAYNSLNTTKKAANTTDYNSAGVKNYPDQATGAKATADTLKLRYYVPIREALVNNKAFSYWYGNKDIIQALKTWGTVNLANELDKTPPKKKLKLILPLVLIGTGLILYYEGK